MLKLEQWAIRRRVWNTTLLQIAAGSVVCVLVYHLYAVSCYCTLLYHHLRLAVLLSYSGFASGGIGIAVAAKAK